MNNIKYLLVLVLLGGSFYLGRKSATTQIITDIKTVKETIVVKEKGKTTTITRNVQQSAKSLPAIPKYSIDVEANVKGSSGVQIGRIGLGYRLTDKVSVIGSYGPLNGYIGLGVRIDF